MHTLVLLQCVSELVLPRQDDLNGQETEQAIFLTEFDLVIQELSWINKVINKAFIKHKSPNTVNLFCHMIM